MQTASSFFPNNSNSNNSASQTSVPLSVYRDLSAELQAAQAMVDVLTTKNEQLVAENQHLRQEITKAVQSTLQLQKSGRLLRCTKLQPTSTFFYGFEKSNQRKHQTNSLTAKVATTSSKCCFTDGG
ncbi:MAG: hypothetical protein HC908_04805 [Calothrix sp. SM1_7_51]|nr:hypothetical protein [Calothrix sp. SM1_7_51]